MRIIIILLTLGLFSIRKGEGKRETKNINILKCSCFAPSFLTKVWVKYAISKGCVIVTQIYIMIYECFPVHDTSDIVIILYIIIMVMSIILILIRVSIDYIIIFDYDTHMVTSYLHNREKYFSLPRSIYNLISKNRLEFVLSRYLYLFFYISWQRPPANDMLKLHCVTTWWDLREMRLILRKTGKNVVLVRTDKLMF